jgi:putative nucleotide binding protein
LALHGVNFEIGERICIGKDGRTKIVSVFGKLLYDEITSEAKNNLPIVIEKLIKTNEKRFISYFNELQPITPRLHALELIPGIGKTFMKQIIIQREKKPFTDFEDLQQRVGLRDPSKQLTRRIMEEISGGSRFNIFVKK